MRIDNYARVTEMYNIGQSKPKVKNDSSKSFSDQLQISSVGKDIQIAKAAVSNASDVREDLVSSLKEQINNGEYSVDSDSLAEKLFASYNRAL